MLPRQQLASLLEDHFFPKWHAVLRHWLAHAPDYDEVTAWYLGWKARALCLLFPLLCPAWEGLLQDICSPH